MLQVLYNSTDWQNMGVIFCCIQFRLKKRKEVPIMSKRTLLLVVALIVSLAVASTGTLAYLTATDSDVNVMTLGNVDIEQHEMKRAEGIAHNTTLKEGDLVPFEEGVKLYPAYPVNNATGDYSAEGTDGSLDRLMYWGPYVHTGTAGNGLWDDAKLVGAVDKMVFVENTGSSDAYFRTVIAYECPEGIEIGEASQGAEIMINENGSTLYGAITERFVDYITVDGVRYAMLQYVYADALLPGEWSHPSLLQVVMTHNATNEDMALLGETYEILVVSQAVATENMPENAAEALNAAFGELSATSHPWMAEGEEGAQPPYESEPEAPIVLVETADELIEALENGKDVLLTKNIKIDPASMSNAYGKTGINIKQGQTLDGNGYTIDVAGAGGTWDSGINTTGGLIKDVTITGSFRGIFINHTSTHSERVILENVTTENTVYTISCDQGLNQGLTATGCTFNGWTSFAGTLGEAKFVNCTFGEGSGYAYMRPYAPTEYVGCEFEAGYTVDPRANISFENCTLGGQPLTADNLSDLVTSTDKVTLK